jgi:hypothetical protein
MDVRAFAFMLAILAAPSMAAEPVALHCARSTGEFPDAQMTFNERGTHVVHVTFVGYRPSRSRAHWSLRDCLSTASKLDASRKIEARLWYRERGVEAPVEPLEPAVLTYKPSRGISASSSESGALSSAATR